MFEKIIITISRPPGISKHNVVGYLIDSESQEEFDRLMKPDDDGLPKYVFGAIIEGNEIEYNEYGEFAKYTIEALTTWHDDDVKYKFITKSNLYKVFGLDVDGDLLSPRKPEPEKIVSDEYWYHHYSASYCDEGIYYVRNKHLRNMKEYPFNRTKFSEQFSKYIASDDKTLERIEDVLSGNHIVGDFRIWDEEGEVYILHLPSGTIVGWYKFYHYGRCNFCNKDMSIEDLEDFFSLLRNQLLEEADEPDELRPLTVTVEETVDESKVDNSTPDVASTYPNTTESMESETARSLAALRKFYKEEQLRLKTLMNTIYGAGLNNDEEKEES